MKWCMPCALMKPPMHTEAVGENEEGAPVLFRHGAMSDTPLVVTPTHYRDVKTGFENPAVSMQPEEPMTMFNKQTGRTCRKSSDINEISWPLSAKYFLHCSANLQDYRGDNPVFRNCRMRSHWVRFRLRTRM